MISLRGLGKPQYFKRPVQILRRLSRELRRVKHRELVLLPWNLSLEVDPMDVVGRALANQGLYDIITTEVAWRLTQPGDRTLDVGANVGYFTSLLAFRAGPSGAVHAWEPHPETFRLLRQNVESWREDGQLAEITLFQMALSNRDGTAALSIPEGCESNASQAFLSTQAGGGLCVPTTRLASFLDSSAPIGVMKVDAEYHEAQILEGAGDHLRAGRIRDVIFEEHAPFPAPSHNVLLSANYQIYWFEERFRGLKVIAPNERARRREYDIAPSYLATRDPERALRLLSAGGWKSF